MGSFGDLPRGLPLHSPDGASELLDTVGPILNLHKVALQTGEVQVPRWRYMPIGPPLFYVGIGIICVGLISCWGVSAFKQSLIGLLPFASLLSSAKGQKGEESRS